MDRAPPGPDQCRASPPAPLDCSFSPRGRSVIIRRVDDTEPSTPGQGRPDGEEKQMKGLIAAAGLSTRLQDLSDKRNKVLLDLGGETLLGNLLNLFHASDITETYVPV